jgi:hypothetical protein
MFRVKKMSRYIGQIDILAKILLLLSSMLKLHSVRAIPNVIPLLSFVFSTNLIWLIYYIVTQ